MLLTDTETAELLDFLASGQIGPFLPDMPMIKALRILGEPIEEGLTEGDFLGEGSEYHLGVNLGYEAGSISSVHIINHRIKSKLVEEISWFSKLRSAKLPEVESLLLSTKIPLWQVYYKFDQSLNGLYCQSGMVNFEEDSHEISSISWWRPLAAQDNWAAFFEDTMYRVLISG